MGSMICIVLANGTRIDAANVISSGIDGFIIRTGRNVLKVPKLYGHLDTEGNLRADDDNDLHFDDLEVEKQVYLRLHNVPGIAKCLEISADGILLEYYSNGSLSDYISQHEAPSASVRWTWVLQAVEAVMHCHENGVLVFDIAPRNFVIAQDLSLRIIDFANSALLPSDSSTDISEVNFEGCTTALDLLHLSNVIYSILTWQDFHINCASESEWPTLNIMPNVESLDHGRIIKECWLKKYKTVHDLMKDLRSFATPSVLPTTDAIA